MNTAADRSEDMQRSGRAPDRPVVEVRDVGKNYPLVKHPFDRLRQLWRPIGRLPRDDSDRVKPALSGVSFQVRVGEVFAIVGRNGSGKSTLLRIIAGVIPPSTGSVQTRGRVAALLELGAGFNPEFSGRDNVMISASLMGVDEASTLRRMAEIETFADVGDYFDQPVKTYSSGMYARVAFAVMAVCEPDVLILDEILAVGDEAFQRKCLARIKQLAEQGCAVILVTHNSQLVLEFCATAALIDQGVLAALGEPKAVIHDYYRRQGMAARSQTNQATTQSAPAAVPAYLDDELPQSSRVETGDGSAQISAVRILDERGVEVNVLSRGSQYRFCYRVLFKATARDVECGSLVKTRSGVEVGGIVLGDLPELTTIEADQTLEVELPFVCRLLPNHYFFNAGVRAQGTPQQPGMHYLHRIMDALMFQVRPEANLAVTGMVDLSDPAHAPVVRLR